MLGPGSTILHQHRIRILAACLLVTAGCTGNLHTSDGSSLQYASSDSGSATFAAVTPGTVTLHRLNKTEYNNSVHDLLGTQQTPADNFAADPTANGFDNNADALTLSTSNLQFYQTAAESLATELADPSNPQFAKLAPCQNTNQMAACVSSFIQKQGLRTWRRPLTSDEVTLISNLAATTAPSSYPEQIETADIALLMSPYFLFRVELDPNNALTQVHDLSAYELATRLAYFLWSSTPDDTLLAAAEDGSLLTDAGLQTQVTRMLADPHAVALTSDFAGQWLELRATAAMQPDPNTFPTWDENLRSAMIQQTELTFGDLLNGSAPLSSLFTSDTTYMNDRLAQHYGMPAVGSSTLKKVPAGTRKGLLTQAAVLASTSFAIRTSLVRRGSYVMSQLLCIPPAPPPANVPQLPAGNSNYVTQRQRLEEHVNNPSCAACHSTIDPYGFVLEPFNAIGASRTTDNGGAIDPTATLQDGTHLSGVADLTTLMATDVRVPNCMVQQLFIYSLGRSLQATDTTTLAALQAKFINNNQRVDQLIQSIVLSDAFRMRQGVK